MTSQPARPIGPPRHQPSQLPAKVTAYQKAVAQAEKEYTDLLDKLNSEYLHLLSVAGQGYARAAERALHVYDSIEGPARQVYEQQARIADNAYKGIIDPATTELTRLTQQAQDMYSRAIAPIEAAYQRALAEAQAATQGMTLTSVGG